MGNLFLELGVEEAIVKALESMGFTAPTEVQQNVIPTFLQKKDLVVMAKTGSGKTAAFGIPLVQLIDQKGKRPKALILAPTRELAVQVESDIRKMASFKKLSIAVVYGQHSMQHEIQSFEKGVDILIGTPGRVYDHLEQGHFDPRDIAYLVLDEADRMLDMGFIDQVMRIIKRIPKQRNTLLFSATMPPEIQKICLSYMQSPETIAIHSDTKTVDAITQIYYQVDSHDKRRQLHRILTVENPDSCVVFCNTRMAVDMVNDYLNRKGYASKAIHGANSQTNRMRSMGQFKKGAFQILCATDVAARGIHIDDLKLVVNYDVPLDLDSYIHRIGRTGRAGNAGKAITLVTSNDLFDFYQIEEHIGMLIHEEQLPTDEQVKAAPKRVPVTKPETVKKTVAAPKGKDHKALHPSKQGHSARQGHPPKQAHPARQGHPPKQVHSIKEPPVQQHVMPVQEVKPGFFKRVRDFFTPKK